MVTPLDHLAPYLDQAGQTQRALYALKRDNFYKINTIEQVEAMSDHTYDPDVTVNRARGK